MSSWEGYHGGALPWIPTLRRVGGSGVEEELDTRRHGLSHKLYSSCMLVLWMLACCANFVLVLLGSLVPVPDLTSALQKLTSAVGKEWDPSVVARRTVGWGESGRGGDRRCRVPAVSQNPIGRALSHVWTFDVFLYGANLCTYMCVCVCKCFAELDGYELGDLVLFLFFLFFHYVWVCLGVDPSERCTVILQ